MKTENEIVFTGVYKEELEAYVTYKKSLGFFGDSEKRELLCLAKLNEYLDKRHPDKVVLDEETVKGYVTHKDFLSQSTRHAYECRIRQFALFLRNKGYSDIYILIGLILCTGLRIPECDVKKLCNGGFIDKGKDLRSHFNRFSNQDAPDIAGTEFILGSRSNPGIAHTDKGDLCGILFFDI